VGVLQFAGADGTDLETVAASISCDVDGTPGTNDMPGRLVFSTAADGASNPTERMRIASDGFVSFGGNTTTGLSSPAAGQLAITRGGVEALRVVFNAIQFHQNSTNTPGFTNTTAGGSIENNGTAFFSRSGEFALSVNRSSTDGNVVIINQDGTQEGAISVSGTTVTYGGGHLARWSQLLNDEDPSYILKGTVMSNLDEMCEWGEEDNEQLNKTKVSDVEGDPNVAGVFVSTSPSDDGLLDFFVAMTGDMIIRIAEGVTVQRGDLLMSAGDGTAKPQDDDIVRSKTIAKVTSTHVTCTYDDGSYCVPCVLMAC
jgi:hypothetical protein